MADWGELLGYPGAGVAGAVVMKLATLLQKSRDGDKDRADRQYIALIEEYRREKHDSDARMDRLERAVDAERKRTAAAYTALAGKHSELLDCEQRYATMEHRMSLIESAHATCPERIAGLEEKSATLEAELLRIRASLGGPQ